LAYFWPTWPVLVAQTCLQRFYLSRQSAGNPISGTAGAQDLSSSTWFATRPLVTLNLDLAGLQRAAGAEGGNATHIVAGWRCLFVTSISAGSMERKARRASGWINRRRLDD
jgi:hypothetical protein